MGSRGGRNANLSSMIVQVFREACVTGQEEGISSQKQWVEKVFEDQVGTQEDPGLSVPEPNFLRQLRGVFRRNF